MVDYKSKTIKATRDVSEVIGDQTEYKRNAEKNFGVKDLEVGKWSLTQVYKIPDGTLYVSPRPGFFSYKAVRIEHETYTSHPAWKVYVGNLTYDSRGGNYWHVGDCSTLSKAEALAEALMENVEMD